MHRNTLRLSPLALSLAIATALSGCANLPAHDGSLRSVYGMDQQASERYARVEDVATPVENTSSAKAQTSSATALAAEPDTPVVRTLNNGASIVSQPIGRSPEVTAQPTLAPRDDVPLTNNSEATLADISGPSPAISPVETSVPTEQSATLAQTTTPAPQPAPIPVSEDRVIRHTVNNTDTLSSIAEQYTGDAGQWRAIAEFNGLARPYSIRVGDELLIPDETVPAPLPQQTASNNGIRLPLTVVPPTKPATPTQHTASNAVKAATPSQPNKPSVELVRPTANNAEQRQAETVTPAVQAASAGAETTVNATEITADTAGQAGETQVGGFRQRLGALTALVKTGFRKSDSEENTTAAEAAEVTEAAPALSSGAPTVRVTGNFTPKAVYKAPDYAASLLMRVAPGSTFESAGREGDWVAITTDQGSGYIFHRDVQVVE